MFKGVLNLLLDSFYYKEKGLFAEPAPRGSSYLNPCFSPAGPGIFPSALPGRELCGDSPDNLGGGRFKALKNYLKFALWVVLLVLAINPLVNQSGNTVLWQSPHLPLAGRLSVTLEAVLYGAAMGLRLLNIVVIFCLYNLIVHPDRILNMISRFAHKPALVISLSTRLLPVLAASLNNIREAQQLRGVDFSDGSLKKRVGRYTAMLNVLMISSLEDSLQIAEAMQARAFGSGPRSIYRRDLFRPRTVFAWPGAFSPGRCCLLHN